MHSLRDFHGQFGLSENYSKSKSIIEPVMSESQQKIKSFIQSIHSPKPWLPGMTTILYFDKVLKFMNDVILIVNE
jgi:hypothetical protein